MNALKHMEAAFVIALSVAGIGSFVAGTAQDAQAIQAAQASAPRMAVVAVVGKRLTPAEKAASLRAEAAATTLVASR